MWTSLKRVSKSGFVDFWRNRAVSVASVFIMTVTLFVLGALIFLQATFDSTLVQLKNKVDVNVYMVTTAPEEDILALKKMLEGLPEVAQVDYTSREAALNDFRERHEDDQLTLQALDELSENPLGAVLTVKAKETVQYENIATVLQANTTLGNGHAPIIDKVNYFQNKVAIDRLAAIIGASEKLGLGVTLILAALSILITFNTIRLAIYTAKDEIAVMRLVGASQSYVRGPFVIEGMLAGVSAAFIALAMLYPLTYWLGPITENFFSGINVFSYYAANFGQIFALVVGCGVLLGGVSSFMATRQYLKV